MPWLAAVRRWAEMCLRLFGRQEGYRAQMFGLNTIALRRHGFSAVRMATLKAAFELLFRQGHRLQEAIKLARNEYGESTDVLSLLTFLESTSRGICQVSSRELDDDEE